MVIDILKARKRFKRAEIVYKEKCAYSTAALAEGVSPSIASINVVGAREFNKARDAYLKLQHEAARLARLKAS